MTIAKARFLIRSLILLVLAIAISIPITTSANDKLVHDEIYIIHSYGNMVVAIINRSAFRYLGDGYWLLTLPNIDAVTFSSKLVKEIIGKFIGSRALYLRLRIIMTANGYRIAKVTSVKTSNTLTTLNKRIVDAIIRALRSSSAREVLISLLEGKVIRIDVVATNRLNVEEIVKKFSSIAKDYKVVIIETMGLGIPSYFDARDLYESLRKIPCFINMDESLYGINIWLNISCIKELATTTGKSFNEVLQDIINSIKALNPLIRKYLPYQGIVIVIAQPPPPAMPLSGELKPVKKIEIRHVGTLKTTKVVTSTEAKLKSREIPQITPGLL